MKKSTWYLGILLLALLLVSSCSGGKRNCLVIPAQIDLVRERREAVLVALENKAKQIDRMKASLDRTRNRFEDLQAEKALLDSLIAAEGASGQGGN